MLYPAEFTAVGNRNHLGLPGAEIVFIRGSQGGLQNSQEGRRTLRAWGLCSWEHGPKLLCRIIASGVDASDWLRLGHMPSLCCKAGWDSASRDVLLLCGGGGNGGQGLLPKMGNSQILRKGSDRAGRRVMLV